MAKPTISKSPVVALLATDALLFMAQFPGPSKKPKVVLSTVDRASLAVTPCLGTDVVENQITSMVATSPRAVLLGIELGRLLWVSAAGEVQRDATMPAAFRPIVHRDGEQLWAGERDAVFRIGDAIERITLPASLVPWCMSGGVAWGIEAGRGIVAHAIDGAGRASVTATVGEGTLFVQPASVLLVHPSGSGAERWTREGTSLTPVAIPDGVFRQWSPMVSHPTEPLVAGANGSGYVGVMSLVTGETLLGRRFRFRANELSFVGDGPQLVVAAQGEVHRLD